jgi:hypothetical protein
MKKIKTFEEQMRNLSYKDFSKDYTLIDGKDTYIVLHNKIKVFSAG